jgi:cyclophilin family peptidyl-prolyl cis-trans isomerase
MKLFLLIFISVSIQLSAQYTPNDKKLAATTFTRNFDKATCTEYLKSNDGKKVIAGLLSVSHSEDTAFVPTIISLPAQQFAREMCFALGQIGYCNRSINYLEKLYYQESDDPLTKYYALVALGKIADSSFAEKIVSEYNSADSKLNFNGISLSLYYLFTSGNISAELARPVLENELYSSSSRQFEAAFSLYRIDPAVNEKDLIVKTIKKIIKGKLVSPVTLKPLPYLVGCLRKLEFFPDDFSLFKQLESLNNFQIKIEAVKSFSFCNFKTEAELDNYLKYLDDSNKNISREAATSLKNLHLTTELKDYLYLKLSERLHKLENTEKYTQGELFMSYLSLFPHDFNDVLIETIDDKISPDYLYKICGLFPGSGEALKILAEKYFNASLPEKISILESILNFNQTKPEVKFILLSALGSKDPALISVTSEGIDTSFINVNKDTLVTLIKRQISENFNNPEFIESMMSLENLSGKISTSFKESILETLAKSKLYSVRNFEATQSGISIKSISKDIDEFDIYWNNAFKYQQAEIVTQKGSFRISFLPEYAPVTVGSFCSLAEKGFFNGIIFHRVVPGFVVQGGDPTGTGWGGPGYEIISEFSPMDCNEGTVGMASAGKDTEGSQWFVTTGDYPHLNGRYTVFAEVLSGLDIVEKLTQDDKILKVNLIR